MVILDDTEMTGSRLACTDNFQLESIKADGLHVELAKTQQQLDQARALRYRIFFQEMGGIPSEDMKSLERDFDEFDAVCDHMLVIDHSGDESQVVGTYRLLRSDVVDRVSTGFYTQGEYDLSKLLVSGRKLAELGRSCVDENYRKRTTIQLLWHGIAQYMEHYHIEVLFGCGSFNGLDLNNLMPQLSYLYHYHLAPEDIRTRALEERYVGMNLMPKEDIDVRRMMVSLPPLIKGYLRVGALIGDGAVCDDICNTTDVCIMLDRRYIVEKYFNHYLKSEIE